MRKHVLLSALAILLVMAVVPSSALDWDLHRDFSKTANPNGQWTYGVYLEDWFDTNGYPDGWYTWPGYLDWPGEPRIGYYGNPGGDINAGCVFYTNSDTPFGANQWWAPRKVMLHPGGAGSAYAPVIRWTAPVDIIISVDAFFYGCEDGTDVDVRILHNGNMFNGPIFTGEQIFEGVVIGNYGYEPLGIPPTATANNVAYSGTVSMAAGDRLDFVANYGPDYLNASDLCGLDIVITEVMGQGIISGTVTANTAGHPGIPGATVELVGQSISTTTSSNGTYSMLVDPGVYTVRASYPTAQAKHYTVTVGTDQTITQDFDLDPRVGTTYYVNAASGDDNNDGLTRTNAWRTIQNGNTKGLLPGDVVKVAPGLYESTTWNGVHIQAGGDLLAKIRYTRDEGAGSGNVVIDSTSAPGDEDGAKIAVTIDANYVIFDGFEVIGGQWGICTYNVSNQGAGRHNVEVANCIVHGQRPSVVAASAHSATAYQWAAGINNSIGSNLTCRNNLIYDIGYPELHWMATCIASPFTSNVKIYNNTLLNANSGIAHWGGSTGEFKNNIVANMRAYGVHSSYSSEFVNSTMVHANNLYFNNACDFGWLDATYGTNEFNCNPRLVSGGYTLDAGSPAINGGVDVGYAYQGPAPDIGAYETSSTAATNAILAGKVTANVTGHPAITRAAISAGGVVLGATDQGGNYRFPVVAGNYNLSAARGGFVTGTGSVTVAAGATGTRDFDLSKAAPTTWYVNATSGNDANNGQTPSTAWATISRGDALGVVKPGDTVMVAGGTYAQDTDPARLAPFQGVMLKNCFGESSSPITYKADGIVTINQATVRATDNTSFGIVIDTDYTQLLANSAESRFDISNCQYGVIVQHARRGNTVANCWLHDIQEAETSGNSYLSQCSGVYLAATRDIVLRNNVLHSIGDLSVMAESAAGFILDSGGAGAKAYNNTTYSVVNGMLLRNGTTGTVIKNNAFGLVYLYGIHAAAQPQAFVHSNNLFQPNDMGLSGYGGNCTPGMGEFTVDPWTQVFDPSTFELTSGSPAVNMGVDVGLPFLGPAPDLGAYETAETGYPTDFCVVKGTVRYRSSGLPAEGVTVSLPLLSMSAVTAADGTYSFVTVETGIDIKAHKKGYAPEYATLNLTPGTPVVKDFYLSPGTAGVWDIVDDFSLANPPTGAWSFLEANAVDPSSATLLPDTWTYGAGTQVWTRWLDPAYPGVETSAFPTATCNPTNNQISVWAPRTVALHPGDSALGYGSDFCVARWTAPASGTYEVHVVFGDQWFAAETVTCHLVLGQAGGVTTLTEGVLAGPNQTLPYFGLLELAAGDTIDAFVGNNGAFWSDTTPIRFTVFGNDAPAADVASVAEAKAFGDGKLVAFTSDQIVTVATGTLSNQTAAYIESEDRTAGIKIVGATVALGQKVKFQGYIDTDDNGERFISVVSGTLTTNGTGSVKSLGMLNKTITTDTTGLLVRVWGVVTEIDALGKYVILDDGSGVPIKVMREATTKTMAIGKMVGVTGPAGVVAEGLILRNVVRARSNNDIVQYN